MNKGDKIIVTFYGVEYRGTVAKNQTSPIIWVVFDGENNPRWFHECSVKKA